MTRPLIVCALLAVCLPAARAEETKETQVVRLAVRPMAAPKPALKYQLLPELKDLNPGNPVQGYLKCFMEQQHFFFDKEVAAQRDKWLDAPLQDLPVEKLRDYGHYALKQADYAARLDNADWQVLLQAKREGAMLLLPEVQQMRSLANALVVRFRGEIADRRHADAIRTAQTLLALARHLGEHPTMIGELVGMAIVNRTTGPLEELIQQPGCPNLYWALANLPTPLIDIRLGVQGERLLFEPVFSAFTSTEPMHEKQLEDAIQQLADVMMPLENLADNQRNPRAIPDWIAARAKDEKYLIAARMRLMESGLAEELLREFPALQVVVLAEKLDYETQLDDAMKWMTLPYWQAEAGLMAATPKAKDNTLFGSMIPAFVAVRRAQARTDQRLAMLRMVEALRLYAAEHDGRLPEKLEDVMVPLAIDPVTGKPFIYTVNKQTATVAGSPPRGLESNPAHNVRYEVTIAK